MKIEIDIQYKKGGFLRHQYYIIEDDGRTTEEHTGSGAGAMWSGEDIFYMNDKRGFLAELLAALKNGVTFKNQGTPEKIWIYEL